MTNSSKYFDSLRAATTKSATKGGPAKKVAPDCQWNGCPDKGTHKAPMGRGKEGHYFAFCVEHVRQYNASYNYFLGMSDEEMAKFQKDALTGHRPTWKTGATSGSPGTGTGAKPGAKGKSTDAEPGSDPHGFFSWRAKRVAGEGEAQKYVRPLDRKALNRLNLSELATKEEIKARYKDLVKKHHPDTNGGDARSADTLREIIQAYNQLKASGLVS